MKKLFLTVVAVWLLAGGVAAQQWETSNWTVRTGLNIASVDKAGYSTDDKVGFQIGALYEHRLTDMHPIYFETGAALTQKGYKSRMGNSTEKASLWYLELPFTLNYKVALDDSCTLVPSVGFYYALGMGGKIKTEGMAPSKVDAFGNESKLNRSDLGVRIGCAIELNRYQIAAVYSIGMFDYSGKSSTKIKNQTLSLLVGYRF